MMNPNHPLYNTLYGMPQQQSQQPAAYGGKLFANPMQQMAYIMQAMRNPAAFVRQNLPGIPESAFNDPSGNQVLQYMMSNMGVTQQDIQNVSGQIPRF